MVGSMYVEIFIYYAYTVFIKKVRDIKYIFWESRYEISFSSAML